MTEEDVTKLLRQIGPHVVYRHVGSLIPGASGVRAWYISEHQAGPLGKKAALGISDAANLDQQDWEALISEGKRQYQSSGGNNASGE